MFKAARNTDGFGPHTESSDTTAVMTPKVKMMHGSDGLHLYNANKDGG